MGCKNLAAKAVYGGALKDVYDMSYSPDERHIVTSGGDNRLLKAKGQMAVWDVQTGQLEKVFGDHTNIIKSFSYNRKGDLILTTSCDGDNKIWNANNYAFEQEIPMWANWSSWCTERLVVHPSDTLVAISDDKWIYIYQTRTWEEKTKIYGDETQNASIDFSPDGKYFICPESSYSIEIEVYNVEDWQELRSIPDFMDSLQRPYQPLKTKHRGAVYTAKFSPDSKTFVTASADRTAKVWEVETGKHLFTLKGHNDKLTDARYTPDGRFIVTSSDDSKLIYWDAKTGQQVVTLIQLKDGNYISYTVDNYYMATKQATSDLTWYLNEKFYPFEQFDLKYNRPDIVLSRLGYADSTLIDAYHKAYLKRLKKWDSKRKT